MALKIWQTDGYRNAQCPGRKQKLDKFAIAAALQEIAALLELKGGTDCFQEGARLPDWRTRSCGMREDRRGNSAQSLTSMRGIGNALASQIEQLYLTGQSSVLRGLKKDFPPGIVELSGVPSLSIQEKSKLLHEALGIIFGGRVEGRCGSGPHQLNQGLRPKERTTTARNAF